MNKEMKSLFEILLTIDGKEEFGKNYVSTLKMQKKMKTVAGNCLFIYRKRRRNRRPSTSIPED